MKKPSRPNKCEQMPDEASDLLAGQINVNLPAQAAVNRDRCDTFHALEARRQVVCRHLAEGDWVDVALDADAHDRK